MARFCNQFREPPWGAAWQPEAALEKGVNFLFGGVTSGVR